MRSGIIITSVLTGIWCAGASLFASTPIDYYAAVDATTPATLQASINNIISAGHVRIGYDNTWGPLRDIDESSTSTNDVRLIYGAGTRDKLAGSAQDSNPLTGGWSREHAFPQSFFSQNEPMRSDIHALFPADADINNRRSNSPYDYVPSPTLIDLLGNRSTTSVFEPSNADKGRAARAILYMAIRYEGEGSEPDLTIINGTPGGTGFGQMAYLNTMLEWHRQFPPNAFEKARNHKAYTYQRNANPFVDHPEWVSRLFGGAAWQPGNGDSLTVTSDAPATRTVSAGGTRVPILIIPTQTVGQEIHLSTVQVENTGDIPDDQLTKVQLWYDADANGVISQHDTALAESAFTSGSAALVVPDPLALYSGFNQLLLTADFGFSAETSRTVQFRIPANGMNRALSGGEDMQIAFPAFESNAFTVANPLDSLGSLLISEVFEGTAGNLKYIEFYNPTSSTVSFDDSGLRLRRYTNGNSAPTTLSLTGIVVPAEGFYVLANNLTDFQGAFGFAPSGVNTNISHNGNDCYDLFHTSSSLVIDSFAGDRAAFDDSFCTDRVAYRLIESMPNNGDWGGALQPADSQLSPSGFWKVKTITVGNGNAATVGTPGSLGESSSSVGDWKDY